MGLVYLDDEDPTAGGGYWRPFRRWHQQEVRDMEHPHRCRRCGEWIVPGRLHLRLWVVGTGPQMASMREHLPGGCRREAISEVRQWGFGSLLFVVVACVLVVAALAVMGAFR